MTKMINQKLDIFKALVEYHCTKNLDSWLSQAKVCDYSKTLKANYQLEEGWSENNHTKGVLILATNSDLVNYLREAHVVIDGRPLDHEREWNRTRNLTDLESTIEAKASHDSSFVFDTNTNQITKIFEFNNDRRLVKDFSDYVPMDFLSLKEQIDLGNVGSAKTKNAIRIPVHYMENVVEKIIKGEDPKDPYLINGEIRESISPNDIFESYLLKTTPYGNVRMGKVGHFDKDGLVKEFFFLHDPKYEAAQTNSELYINPELHIVGVMKTYRNKDNTPNVVDGTLKHTAVYTIDKNCNILFENSYNYVNKVLKRNEVIL